MQYNTRHKVLMFLFLFKSGNESTSSTAVIKPKTLASVVVSETPESSFSFVRSDGTRCLKAVTVFRFSLFFFFFLGND